MNKTLSLLSSSVSIMKKASSILLSSSPSSLYRNTSSSLLLSKRNISTTSSLLKKCNSFNNKLSSSPPSSSICYLHHSPLYHPHHHSNNQLLHQYQSKRAMGCKRFLKTKQSAAKRFIVTGKGKLKFSHQGKAHLNGHKSRKRIRRLNVKGRVTGTMEKNMKMLILTGK